MKLKDRWMNTCPHTAMGVSNYTHINYTHQVSKRRFSIKTAQYQCQTSAKLITAAVKRDMQEITVLPLSEGESVLPYCVAGGLSDPQYHIYIYYSMPLECSSVLSIHSIVRQRHVMRNTFLLEIERIFICLVKLGVTLFRNLEFSFNEIRTLSLHRGSAGYILFNFCDI